MGMKAAGAPAPTNAAATDKPKSLMDRIEGMAEDLITLDVVTLSGTVEATIENGKFDFDKFFDSFNANTEQGGVAGKVKVIAATRRNIDQDTSFFVQSGLNTQEQELLKNHIAADEAAQQARMEFLKFVVGMLKQAV